MSVTVQLIFTGLVMLASESAPVSKHSVLLVDHGHYGAVFLVDGDCVPAESCSEVGLANHRLLWDLETIVPATIEFNGVAHGRSVRHGGREGHLNGKPVPRPRPASPDDTKDTDWIGQLSELAGDSGLDDPCLEGRLAGCGDGLRARVRIPHGFIETCHLAHELRTNKVPTAEFVGSLREHRALGNAFVARFEIDTPNGEVELCANPNPGCKVLKADAQNSLTLLIRNENSNLGHLPGLGCGGGVALSRSHFRAYYPVLRYSGSPTTLPYPKLNADAADSHVGSCEGVFSDIDVAIANWGALNGITLEEKDGVGRRDLNFTPALRAFLCSLNYPHSSSVCDTSTYP